MNIAATVKELAKTMGTPKPRAAFGTWPSFAWLVRGLVEKGFGISDAVNHVLDQSGLPNNKQSFGSLRASYYQIKSKEWPAEVNTETEETGFE